MKKIILTSFYLLLFTISLKAQPYDFQFKWEEYFKNNIENLDPIEGIWSLNSNYKFYIKNKLVDENYRPQAAIGAIYKEGENYKLYIFKGNEKYFDMDFIFIKTATSSIFLTNILFLSSNSSSKANAILREDGLLEFTYKLPIEEKIYLIKNTVKNYKKYIDKRDAITFENQLLKIYPRIDDYKEIKSSSGTGFLISSNGIIVTNYHVVENAKSIRVRGLQGNFNKVFDAKILITDKNNDLVLIQIVDNNFSSLSNTPYVIKPTLTSVGEDVFALGYPLRALMGDEIKLTNGIISSKTGFQGDVTSYQVSVPVQPGNSGGPLFDNNGNIIGIVNAKLTIAENASYAIKSSYLMNLIELIDNPPELSKLNTLKGENLSEQVQKIKEFVYIIEVN